MSLIHWNYYLFSLQLTKLIVNEEEDHDDDGHGIKGFTGCTKEEEPRKIPK